MALWQILFRHRRLQQEILKFKLLQAARESSLPDRKKRGSYAKYTSEQKALIAKRAAEHGVVATIRHYAKEFPKLKDTTVRDWRDSYRLELKRKGKESSNVKEVNELPEKKRPSIAPMRGVGQTGTSIFD